MASHAIVGMIGGRAMTRDLADQPGVALDAIRLDERRIPRFDPNRLGKILEREPLGMPESILGLGKILAHEVMRNVTIVAPGHGVMARFLPAIIRVPHHVAVHTGGWIIAEIGAALGIAKGVGTQSGSNADEDADRDGNAAHFKSTRLGFT